MGKTASSQASESSQAPYWRGHFDRWRESGLTPSDYCRQAQLSRHRFKYWRRKLEPATVKRRRQKQRSDFVALQVRPSTLESGLTLT